MWIRCAKLAFSATNQKIFYKLIQKQRFVGSFCGDYALHLDPAVERGLAIPQQTSIIKIINNKHMH